LFVPHRPLVFVSGLTFADYLLWNWSLNSNHAVLALVSGLTLPPLAVACLWLLTLALGRVIAYTTSRSVELVGVRRRRRRRRGALERPIVPPADAVHGDAQAPGAPTSAAPSGASTGKLAA
jgi:hypothetical protein